MQAILISSYALQSADRLFVLFSLSLYNKIFLGIFTIDFFLASIAKGLIYNQYSYLSEVWNVVDSFGTLYLWISYYGIFDMTHTLGVEPIGHSIYNKAGFSEFFRLLRTIRLVKELRSVIFLQEFRIIVRILLSFVPKMLPMILVMFFILSGIANFVVKATKDIQPRVCWPHSFPEKYLPIFLEYIASQKTADSARITPIVQEILESGYLPTACGIHDEIPLTG